MPVSAIKPVRLNNSVRGAIDAALGSLRLFDPNASVRLEAAEAVFQSHDPAAIPALDRALAKETDASVKLRMEQARAAAILSDPDATQDARMAAVGVLRTRGDQASRSLLSALAGQTGPVAEAAGAAVVSIDHVLQIWSIAQSVYYGISLGSVLLLAAAGLAITFGVMGVINMAHGEMVMIGAYVTFVVQQLMHAYLPSLYGISLLIAVPMAFLVSGLVGVVVERSLIRWLYGRPLETLLATWGLSLVLQQVVRSLFGANNRDVDTPGVDERRHATGRPDPDVEPDVYHSVRISGGGGADGCAALHAAGPADARGDAKPAHGRGDGHPDAVDRRDDIRAWVGGRRHCRCRAVAD